MRRHAGDEQLASSHAERASLLAEKFFPCPEADLSDLDGAEASTGTPPALDIPQGVSPDDIQQVIKCTGAWKAPGEDLLPAGFLKACGKPLLEVLSSLVEASFTLAYYPRRFRAARVVVIPKPNKTTQQRETPGGWRPIALLSAVGKIFEAIIAERITAAAEKAGVLPDGQMGNRKSRSTELAAKVVELVARVSWDRESLASLLLLDIMGAFDTVNYRRLLHILRKKGFPDWVISWVCSFVTDRTVKLCFNGQQTDPYRLAAGVPQGSPLSPILFVLFISTLYEALAAHPRLIVVGFADDTNIMAVGPDTQSTCRDLEEAWAICTAWAKAHGMEFAPDKSELVHFTRGREAPSQPVRLGNATIAPVETTRFLGIWFDRKLSWRTHVHKLKAKATTQAKALARLTGPTWGCDLKSARRTYTAVIRSAMAYGAAVWHQTGPRPTGPARELQASQNECLRIVSGAYRATPIRHLETETAIPPLDLYLSFRAAAFETRIAASGKVKLLDNVCIKTATIIARKRIASKQRPPKKVPPVTSYTQKKLDLALEWQGGPGQRLKTALLEHWMLRWREDKARKKPHGSAMAELRLPDLKLHAIYDTKNLLKLCRKEAVVALQVRTGKTSLRDFLFKKTRIPNIASPLCPCGDALETVEHVFLHCILLEGDRVRLRRAIAPQPLHTGADMERLMSTLLGAKEMIGWLIGTGRLQQT